MGKGDYATYSYDSTTGGNDGVGRLTEKTLNAGASLVAGPCANTYKARGQLTGEKVVLDGSGYPLSSGYNSAGLPTTTATYSTGEVAAVGYTAEGWPSSLATVGSGLTALGYTRAVGARRAAAGDARGHHAHLPGDGWAGERQPGGGRQRQRNVQGAVRALRRAAVRRGERADDQGLHWPARRHRQRAGL